MSNKALLVIDVQEDYTGANTTEKTKYKNSDELVIRLNKIIGECVRRDIDVIYIKQEFKGVGKLLTKLFSHGTAIEGTAGAQFDKRMNIVNSN